jgi:hypothetical protein
MEVFHTVLYIDPASSDKLFFSGLVAGLKLNFKQLQLWKNRSCVHIVPKCFQKRIF